MNTLNHQTRVASKLSLVFYLCSLCQIKPCRFVLLRRQFSRRYETYLQRQHVHVDQRMEAPSPGLFLRTRSGQLMTTVPSGGSTFVPFALLGECNATQRNATQRNATQRNATQRNATQRNATQRNATQRNATQRNATQRNATQRNATQRNATQRNSTQLNSTQLNSTQLNSTQFNSLQFIYIFSVKPKEERRTRGHGFTLSKKQWRLDIKKLSFSQRTVSECNKLSADCAGAS